MLNAMPREDELEILRRAYAKQIVHAARASDPRLEDALAKLRREDFLGLGPWELMRFPGGYQMTPDDDPVYLYQDVPVAIIPAKGLNNGQPSFLTSLVSVGALREGERAVHIGTGTGYYTAVMSRLAGRSGQVIGIEFEPELAARARANLAGFCNVDIIEGDGSTAPLQPADVIFVNAGASRPAGIWLDALRPGGRMILPLTVRYITEQGHAMTRGAVFLITRDRSGYAARCVSGVHIYPCAGLRDEASEKALRVAFENGGFESGDLARITRLHRSDEIPDQRCWVRAPGWSLAYD
ncbi:protein-L-isoaspartate O-methyltransferase family protein [Rhodopseudomonas palustris]|uniref:Protein-L-isoaspartate O-methyltransferase n=1 Tax=Rhodopseudomonas palustris (strain BisB18) TaxID=316056 RepID=Q20XH3_RHOPB